MSYICCLKKDKDKKLSVMELEKFARQLRLMVLLTQNRTHTVEEMCQISVYRAQLLCMMAMQDTKGISERMIDEVIMRWMEYAEEYRRNRDCGAGDEKLFADAESRDLPINEEIKAKMLRTERNLWAYGLNGGRKI